MTGFLEPSPILHWVGLGDIAVVESSTQENLLVQSRGGGTTLTGSPLW